MSTTGTTGVPAAIADYAAAVRRELGDLPKHDVDELTEGLDADLLEQFRESGRRRWNRHKATLKS